MDDYAIEVEHVFKEFRLGVVGHGTLQQDIQSWWARRRGQEDPNTIIQQHLGQHHSGGIRRNDVSSSILALDDISFKVARGDTLAVIGSNGAGKSTLLKILARITAPGSGRVVMLDRIASLLEVGTGFHHEMTGRQNIYFNGAMLGMRRSEINRKFDEIVDFSGVERFIDTPVKRYSSGMYVRLAFSIAAHLDAETLIIDEVLAVGDVEFQKKCTKKMRELATEEGRTILFVSHNMDSVRQLCNRAIILDRGRLVFDSEDVNEAARRYKMSTGSVDGGIWENRHELYPNEFFRPRRMSLNNADDRTIDEPIYPGEAIRVVIEGEVTRPDARLAVGYVLYTETGHPVYCTYNTDANSGETSDFSKGDIVGNIVFSSMLPTDLLNQGAYFLSLVVLVDEGRRILIPGNPIDDARIGFEIERPPADPSDRLGRRVGEIVPRISWKMEKRPARHP